MLKINKKISSAKSLTASMRLDVDAVPSTKKIEKEIDFLARIKSFSELHTGYLDKNLLIKYIVILYSEDSFLNKRIPIPLDERKEQVCGLLGIKITDEIRTNLFDLKDDVTLKMVQDFLIAQNNTLWTEIITTEQQYAEAIRLRLAPVGGSKDKDNLAAAELKKKLREESKIMVNDLDGYYRKLWQGHEDVQKQVRVRAMSLEQIAKGAQQL